MCGWRRWMWFGICLSYYFISDRFPINIELQLGAVVSCGNKAPLTLFPCTTTDVGCRLVGIDRYAGIKIGRPNLDSRIMPIPPCILISVPNGRDNLSNHLNMVSALDSCASTGRPLWPIGFWNPRSIGYNNTSFKSPFRKLQTGTTLCQKTGSAAKELVPPPDLVSR